MVWFQYQKKKSWFRKRNALKFIKKFDKQNNPDRQYFGPGMYANYLYEPTEQEIQSYEIFPNLMERQSELTHIITETVRSFELHKQENSDLVRLIIRSPENDIVGYAKSLNVDYKQINNSDLHTYNLKNDSRNIDVCFFDFELAYQLNFTMLDANQENIMDKLIRVISSHKDCNIVIQFLFTKSIDWNKIAEVTVMNLSQYLRMVERGRMQTTLVGFDRRYGPKIISSKIEKIKELASSTYQTGKKIEKAYNQKVSSTPITLSIRGVVTGTNKKNALQNISTVINSVNIMGDHLVCFVYDVDHDRGNSWMKNNSLLSEYALKILENNSKMWQDMRWGIMRDFVPFLCLTKDEFPIFVALPKDPTLPITYKRKNLRRINHHKTIFPLGKII